MNESDKQSPKYGAGEDRVAPIVINLGKVSAKKIKKLREGRGPLLENVDDAVNTVREQLKGQLAGKELVPVVLIYRKKPKPSILNPFGTR